ncbi:hypothetical protein PHISCL_06177 [Aspergillus sclerotialis]|uniref:BZIP domain-containing protein n=1 Tax=Aspergillus sclerotialis TaxID=2070753 RepID=A0A3A2ZE99_9EURO|nr:hypothetical protein PHISCL_06177 [Aspergillus sclerotialis]
MSSNDTPPKKRPKRGRPKLEPSERRQFEDRRSQVRRAQRTYRLRKEATVQNLRTRVADLETTLQNVSDILVNFQDTITSSVLNLGSPDIPLLFSDTVDRVLAEIDRSNCSLDRQDAQQESLPGKHGAVKHEASFKSINYNQGDLLDVFGYQVSHQLDEARQGDDVEEEYQQWRQELLSQRHMPRPLLSSLVDAIFSGDSVHPSTFHSSELINPRLLLCILRLLRCFPDAGAGRHSLVDEDARQALPKSSQDLKVTLQHFMDSVLGLEHPETQGEDHFALIRDWVHCHDVRAYLEQMGIILDRSSLLVDIPIQSATMLRGANQTNSENERKESDCIDPNGLHTDTQRDGLNSKVGELMGGDNTTRSKVPDSSRTLKAADTTGPSDYFLDVECFFNILRGNIKFLAYAPGFRKRDINSALRSSMRKRP